MQGYTIFMVLFIVATFVAVILQRINIPFTVALVIVGIALGFFHVIDAPVLTKELLFSIFLPGLLFESAFHIDFNKLWQNRLMVSILAVPGVILSILIITACLTPVVQAFHQFNSFNWKSAMVFGALISASDPVAVLALFSSVAAPRRLALLIDGESLLNDGTAIVFFTLSLALFSGQTMTAGGMTLDFIKVVGVGIVTGVGAGIAGAQVLRTVNDPTVEIALTMIIAYGSFILAEYFDFSGVIATVSAGLVTGNYATRVGMLPSTRLSVETFWKYVSFALNSIVFLLIGLEVNFLDLIGYWKIIFIAFLIIYIARILIITSLTAILRRSREKIPWKWTPVLTWGGLRGALPMVLVLTIPENVPFRDLLIHLTFGVVIISILLQGFTILPLMKWLGIVKKEKSDFDYIRGKLQSLHAAIEELDKMSDLHLFNREILRELEEEYKKLIEDNTEEMKKSGSTQEIFSLEKNWVLRHIFLSQKLNVNRAYYSGAISEAAKQRLLNEIDKQLLSIESQENDGT